MGVSGRYAGVLFTIASKNNVLDKVQEDMQYLHEVVTTSESVTNFLNNASNTRAQQLAVFSTLYEQMNPITVQFIETVVDNKRTTDLAKMATTYMDYCRMLNKEESVRVVR